MINLASNLITTGMVPLVIALALDVYTVVSTALGRPEVGTWSALATIVLLGGLWFVMPFAVMHRH